MYNQFSIVICTYNRCESLNDTLSSLLGQKNTSKCDYEIIVVDNNSSDGTKKVVESYCSEFNGKLKYIFEPNQGKSYALNKGIKEAQGEVIAFTDDDVMVSNNWIESIYNTFVDTRCDVIVGKIKPLWLKIPSSWLTKRFYGNLALLDYGDRPFKVSSDKHEFYGANFAVKRNVFDEIGYFNIRLGPTGHKLLRGEDTELFYRMLSADKTIYYQPDCFVYHKVDEKRMTKAYFRRWYFYSGILEFNVNQPLYRDNKKRYPLGVPYWLFLRLGKLGLRYLNAESNGNKSLDERFEEQLNFFQHLGVIYGAYKSRLAV